MRYKHVIAANYDGKNKISAQNCVLYLLEFVCGDVCVGERSIFKEHKIPYFSGHLFCPKKIIII